MKLSRNVPKNTLYLQKAVGNTEQRTLPPMTTSRKCWGSSIERKTRSPMEDNRHRRMNGQRKIGLLESQLKGFDC